MPQSEKIESSTQRVAWQLPDNLVDVLSVGTINCESRSGPTPGIIPPQGTQLSNFYSNLAQISSWGVSSILQTEMQDNMGLFTYYVGQQGDGGESKLLALV